jgi:hypothetical protein
MIGEGAVAQGLSASPLVAASIVFAAIAAFVAFQTRRQSLTSRRVTA